ncbi:MAG: glycoside hydrolase, partial [Chitinophagaceae bacterium]|nr:glycoside hydrolase [Chitinophagaceae bacterium]
MIKLFQSVLLLLQVLNCISIQAQPATDYRSIVQRSDLHYTSPVTRSEDGMPTGNGKMGSLVWTIPSALKFQINRVDVFGNNSSSHNFFERHTDYCNGVGAVSIDFGTPVFNATHFTQHLDCYDAMVKVKGEGLESDIFTWAEGDIMTITVKDNRKMKLPVQVFLSSLRKPDMRRGDHRALSKAFTKNNIIVLTQQFREGDYYCASAVAIRADGNASTVQDEQGLVRLLLSASPQHRVLMSTAASFDSTVDIANKAIQILEKAKTITPQAMRNSHLNWWHQFWSRSFIQCSSADKEADLLQEHYQYYL